MPEAEQWRGWRLEHEGLTWRIAQPEDLPAIEEILGGVERKYGTQDRPDLMDVPVLITLVCADADGRIVDGIYVELVAEIVKFGLDRSAFSAYEKLLPVIGGLLQARKVRIAQMATLKRWSSAMALPLKLLGFERADGKFAYWVRKVRP